MKQKQRAMTRGELLNLLTETAKKYHKEAISSLERNRHMNNLPLTDIATMRRDVRRTQRLIDALLVDFMNAVGAGQCIDLGLYTKDLTHPRAK